MRYEYNGIGQTTVFADNGQQVPQEALDQMERLKADLRDQFAMAALQGITSHPNGPSGDWFSCAKQAYECADAMLEAREHD